MGWGGIIAGAMGGAAQATSDIAQGQIEDERKRQLAQELSNIDEQKQMRIEAARRQGVREDKKWELTDAEMVAGRGAQLKQAADVQRESNVQQAREMTPIEVERQKLLSRAQIEVQDAANNDPNHIAGLKKVTAATETSATRAAAAESAARTKVLGVELDIKKLGLDDLKALNAQYDRAIALNGDPNVDPKVRQAELSKIQETVALIKAKTGQASGPKESDMVTVEKTELDPKTGAQTKTTTKELRRPGGTTPAPAAKGPPVGTEVSGFVFKGGDPNDKANWEKKAANAAPATQGLVQAKQDEMRGIAFAGDGYSYAGTTYPTLTEAQQARDRAELADNPMSRSMARYGD